MITQETINSELDISKKIYLYYLDQMANYLSIGSDKYIKWYKDLCILYFLTEYIQSIKNINSEFYIGDTTIDEDDFFSAVSNIKEYITSEIRSTIYANVDSTFKVKDYSSPSVPPLIVVYQSGNLNIQYLTIYITEDDIDIVTLPFNINDVQESSVKLTVNDGDPLYVVNPVSEGFHIVENNLHWHSYYNLKSGDVLQFEYILI